MCAECVLVRDGNLYSFSQHNGMRAMNRNEGRFRVCPLTLILLWNHRYDHHHRHSRRFCHRHCRYFRPAKTRSHNCDVRMRGSKTCQTVQVIACGCRQGGGQGMQGMSKKRSFLSVHLSSTIWDFLFDLFSRSFRVAGLKVLLEINRTHGGRQKKKKRQTDEWGGKKVDREKEREKTDAN